MKKSTQNGSRMPYVRDSYDYSYVFVVYVYSSYHNYNTETLTTTHDTNSLKSNQNVFNPLELNMEQPKIRRNKK